MAFCLDMKTCSPSLTPGVKFIPLASYQNNKNDSNQNFSTIDHLDADYLSPLLSASSASTSFSSAVSTSTACSSASASACPSTTTSPPDTPSRQLCADDPEPVIQRPLWMPVSIRPSSHRRVLSIHRRTPAEDEKDNEETGYDSEVDVAGYVGERQSKSQPLCLRERLERVKGRSLSSPRSDSKLAVHGNIPLMMASQTHVQTDASQASPKFNIELKRMVENSPPIQSSSPRTELNAPPPKFNEGTRNPLDSRDNRRTGLIRDRRPPPLNLGNSRDCSLHVARSEGIPHAFRDVARKKAMIGLGLGLGLPSGVTNQPTVTVSMAAAQESSLAVESRRPATAPHWRSVTCPNYVQLSPPPLSAPPSIACPSKPRLLPSSPPPKSPSPLLLGSPKFDLWMEKKRKTSAIAAVGDVGGVKERRRPSIKIMIEELGNSGRESPVPPGLVGSSFLKRYGVGAKKSGSVRKSNVLVMSYDSTVGEGEEKHPDSPWAEVIDGSVALKGKGGVCSFNPYFADADLSAQSMGRGSVYRL